MQESRRPVVTVDIHGGVLVGAIVPLKLGARGSTYRCILRCTQIPPLSKDEWSTSSGREWKFPLVFPRFLLASFQISAPEGMLRLRTSDGWCRQCGVGGRWR